MDGEGHVLKVDDGLRVPHAAASQQERTFSMLENFYPNPEYLDVALCVHDVHREPNLAEARGDLASAELIDLSRLRISEGVLDHQRVLLLDSFELGDSDDGGGGAGVDEDLQVVVVLRLAEEDLLQVMNWHCGNSVVVVVMKDSIGEEMLLNI